MDKNSYKEDNQILMNKIKEMDKKIDAMSLQFAKKEKRTNLQIEKMKKRMDELSLISFENKKKCDELFQILRQNLNLIRRLEIVTQELVVDHNNLVNLTMNLNDGLEQIFPYLDDISNATNPFNNFEFFN